MPDWIPFWQAAAELAGAPEAARHPDNELMLAFNFVVDLTPARLEEARQELWLPPLPTPGALALLTELAEGRRTAEGIRRPHQSSAQAKFEPIADAFWTLALADINRHFDFETSEIFAYSYVRVSRVTPVAPAEQKPVDNINRGSKKYDWDAFNRETDWIAKRAKGLPDRRELMRRMTLYVAGWRPVPGDSTVRGRIAIWYKGQKR